MENKFVVIFTCAFRITLANVINTYNWNLSLYLIDFRWHGKIVGGNQYTIIPILYNSFSLNL